MACAEVPGVWRLQRRRSEQTQAGYATPAITPVWRPLQRQVTATPPAARRVRRQTSLAWLDSSADRPGRVWSVVGLLHGKSVHAGHYLLQGCYVFICACLFVCLLTGLLENY